MNMIKGILIAVVIMLTSIPSMSAVVFIDVDTQFYTNGQNRPHTQVTVQFSGQADEDQSQATTATTVGWHNPGGGQLNLLTTSGPSFEWGIVPPAYGGGYVLIFTGGSSWIHNEPRRFAGQYVGDLVLYLDGGGGQHFIRAQDTDTAPA
jgi:hypothetical protein